MILSRVRSPAGRASALAALTIIGALASAPGHTQGMPEPCGDWAELTRHLEEGFGEVLVGAGVDNSGRLMLEVYASESGTWTVVVTVAGGPSCIKAAGQGWQTHSPRKPKAPEKGT